MAENQEEFPTEISDDMFVRDVPTNENLGSLTNLAQDLQQIQKDILKAESELQALKEREKQLSESELPTVMQDIGMENFTLSDGAKVEIKKIYAGYVKKDQMHDALEYLNSMGYGDAMKNELKASTSPNISQTELIEIQRLLRDKYGVDFEQRLSLHHSTMKKTIRLMQKDIEEAYARGENPEPINPILNPYIGNKVTIK